jgi:hypothetical protein
MISDTTDIRRSEEESIIELAGAVGVDVIAEGVETAEQAVLLRRLGCVTAQGWLWSPAVSMREMLSGPIWLSPSAIARAAAFPGRTTRRGRRGTGLADGLRRMFEPSRTERTYP